MKRKPPKPKRTNPTEPWTEFKRMNYWGLDGEETPIPPEYTIMRNNHYQVQMEQGRAAEPFGEITWLSIKRIDRLPIHDWRDLQRIKNLLCGPEREGIEIYPRESRMVDTSNQYSLWVMPEGFTFPFGYAERLVIDDTVWDQSLAPNAVQRPFMHDARPPGTITGREYDERWQKDPSFGTQRVLHKRKNS